MCWHSNIRHGWVWSQLWTNTWCKLWWTVYFICKYLPQGWQLEHKTKRERISPWTSELIHKAHRGTDYHLLPTVHVIRVNQVASSITSGKVSTRSSAARLTRTRPPLWVKISLKKTLKRHHNPGLWGCVLLRLTLGCIPQNMAMIGTSISSFRVQTASAERIATTPCTRCLNHLVSIFYKMHWKMAKYSIQADIQQDNKTRWRVPAR